MISVTNVFDVSNLNDLLEGREDEKATELAKGFTDSSDVNVSTNFTNTTESEEGPIVPANLVDCLHDTKVAKNSAHVCQLYADDDTEVANDSAHVCQLDADDITDEIDVFGDEDVYLCGEVGCWKDSG